MSIDQVDGTAMTFWLLRWEADAEQVEARARALGGRLVRCRPDGLWRVSLPGSHWRGEDFAPGAYLELEPAVGRIRRPLRRPVVPTSSRAGQRRTVRVVDETSGQPLPGVTVLLEGASGMHYRALTGKDGIARLQLFEPDVIRVELHPAEAFWPRALQAGISDVSGARLEVGLAPLPTQIEPYGWGVTRAMKIDRVHQAGYRGRGVRLAVLDTGVAPHPCLRIVGGANTADHEPLAQWQDTHWHGTHVAGILAGSGAAGGVIGVAPEAELYAVRVGRVDGVERTGFSNQLFETDLLEGIQWCIDHGIEVMNLSLFARQTPALEQVIDSAYRRGIIMVAPSGNHRAGMYGSGFSSVDFPASDPRLLSVGAVGRLGVYPSDSYFAGAEDGALFSPRFPDYYIPGFSKSGQGLDFIAPGVAILSTVPAALAGYDVDNRRLSGYTTWMGTSQASPFIAGLAALILESHPEIRALPDGRKVEAVRAVLTKSAISLQLDPLYQGAGLPFAPACIEPVAGLG